MITSDKSHNDILNSERLAALLNTYRHGLLGDTLPFWLNHCVDYEQGGFMFCLDRDGAVFDTDKGMWQQGRFTWLLATLYTLVEPCEEWLALARHGIEFIRRFGFDEDGRMFFRLTRDGRPVHKRRYVFTETFGVAALAAYAQASGEGQARQEALDLFRLVVRYLTTPGLIPPKFDPQNRPLKSLSASMMLIVTAQILRQVSDDPICDEWIERSIAEIEQHFLKPEFEAVLETVGPQGEFSDHFEGRMLNPGHAIEASWFILAEAAHRGGDAHLVELGTTILDWMWRWGWDDEYGGIIHFRDVKGRPVQEYWHDMKFWWPQCEAIIATLMAYQATGDEKYARWHQMAHDWAHRHFPDPEYGEWFGYLHRDGRLSSPVKGNLWKGPFHIPRMQLLSWQILASLTDRPCQG